VQDHVVVEMPAQEAQWVVVPCLAIAVRRQPCYRCTMLDKMAVEIDTSGQVIRI
jgi:hypothetical protein